MVQKILNYEKVFSEVSLLPVAHASTPPPTNQAITMITYAPFQSFLLPIKANKNL